LRAGFGGYKGRKLENGDILKILHSTNQKDAGPANWGMMPLSHQLPDKHVVIRYIKGPQYNWFTEQAQRSFTHEEYTVLPNSDRMGYRLKGEKLIKNEEKELITEPAAFGTIQVPPDGQPIILMADRQTTGGYPKIGQVITADLPLVAQLPPHTKINFQEITLKEAQRLLMVEDSFFKQVKTAAGMKWRELQG
jgi:antagonist of KipI